MGVASGHGTEVWMAIVENGWNLWVWFECIGVVNGVVARRYTDISLIIITFPYSTCITSFLASSLFIFF